MVTVLASGSTHESDKDMHRVACEIYTYSAVILAINFLSLISWVGCVPSPANKKVFLGLKIVKVFVV